MTAGGPRILLYSHDSYGLGHLRRTMLIAERLVRLPCRPEVLVVTGSPRAQSFSVPSRVDTVKLPAATKDGDRYRSRTLELPIDDLVALRAELIRAAARSFRPDIVLVDHAPGGLCGELRPLLRDVSGPATGAPVLILGLRDFVDDPRAVRIEWARDDVWSLLERYDRILVYGDERIGTTATDLGLATTFPGRVHHVGYLGRAGLCRPHGGRPSPPTVVVTTGGGGDGLPLLDRYADFLESQPAPLPFRSIVVTGPLLAPRRRDAITTRLSRVDHDVDIVEFTDRMEQLVAEAAAVVSMAGYNAVVEALAARTPMLLVPREVPRREQAVRASRLSPLPGVDVCPIGALGHDRLAAFVKEALAAPRPRSPAPIELGGLDRLAAEVEAQLRRRLQGDLRAAGGAHVAAGH